MTAHYTKSKFLLSCQKFSAQPVTVEVNEYTFRGSNSVIFIFASCLNEEPTLHSIVLINAKIVCNFGLSESNRAKEKAQILSFNPIALRRAKFGFSECNRVKSRVLVGKVLTFRKAKNSHKSCPPL